VTASTTGIGASVPAPHEREREREREHDAREHEDALGEPLLRHRLSTRAIHWTMTGFFFVCVLSGMPIWSPLFGWMASLFGGLAVCRWLHPWSGVAYSAAALVLFVHWRREMTFEPTDRGWLGPKLVRFLRHEGRDLDVGKYNGGQKALFWAVSLGALAMLVSGVVLWFPLAFAELARLLAILLHDAVFVLFAMAIAFHVYLGTAALPGALRAMTRGTVDRSWARLHHPRWYREVTGDDPRRE